MATELTVSSEHADSTLSDLLDQIEISIRRFTVDDHRSIYARVGAAGTEDIVIVLDDTDRVQKHQNDPHRHDKLQQDEPCAVEHGQSAPLEEFPVPNRIIHLPGRKQ